jgi:hypothetical protein
VDIFTTVFPQLTWIIVSVVEGKTIYTACYVINPGRRDERQNPNYHFPTNLLLDIT